MSSLQKALFEAAREDAPRQEARDAMWERVTVTTGIAAATVAAKAATSAAPGVAAQGAAVAAKGGTKALLVGGLIGASGTALGVLVTFWAVAPETSSPPAARQATAVVQRDVAAGARLSDPSARSLDTASVERSAPAPSVTAAARSGAPQPDTASDLAEEARLVTEARAALVRGDAAAALALVQATRRIATRSLEPEELGLEARALRSLGRADEAAATELILKRRFPDSALAR